jgi:hypothetical protein
VPEHFSHTLLQSYSQHNFQHAAGIMFNKEKRISAGFSENGSTILNHLSRASGHSNEYTVLAGNIKHQ